MSNVASAFRLSRHQFKKRETLLMTSASAALAAAMLAPQKAEAQAYARAPTTVSGTVTYDRSTRGVETVNIGSPTATIKRRGNRHLPYHYQFRPGQSRPADR